MSTQEYSPDRSFGALAADITPNAKPLPRRWRIDMWRMERRKAEIDRLAAKFAAIEVSR